MLNKDQFPEFNKEIEKKIMIGNKRLSLVMSVWSFLCIIPYFLLRGLIGHEFAIITWMVLVIVGVSFSNKICNKIWKD